MDTDVNTKIYNITLDPHEENVYGRVYFAQGGAGRSRLFHTGKDFADKCIEYFSPVAVEYHRNISMGFVIVNILSIDFSQRSDNTVHVQVTMS